MTNYGFSLKPFGSGFGFTKVYLGEIIPIYLGEIIPNIAITGMTHCHYQSRYKKQGDSILACIKDCH